MNVFSGRSICYSMTLISARGLLHCEPCVYLMMRLQCMTCDLFGDKLNRLWCLV